MTCTVEIKPQNFVENGSFEDPKSDAWIVTAAEGFANCTDYQKNASDALDGEYALHFWSASDIDFTLAQKITGLESGVYTLQASVQGGDAETQDMSIFAKVGKEDYSAKMEVTSWANWDTAEITGIKVNAEETVEIGAHVAACAGAWGTIDEFVLYRTGDLAEEETNEEQSTEGNRQESASSGEESSNDVETSTPVLTNIADINVPMAERVVENGELPYAEISFANEKALLKLEVMQKYYGRNLYLMAFLGNGVGYSISKEALGMADADLNLESRLEEVKDFAADFETFRLQPVKEIKLAYQIGLHINVGAEYAGKTAYVFSKNLVTGVYQLSKTMTVSEIGNVGFYTDEMTDVMVLIAK